VVAQGAGIDHVLLSLENSMVVPMAHTAPVLVWHVKFRPMPTLDVDAPPELMETAP